MKFTKNILIIFCLISLLSLASCDTKDEAELIYQVDKYSCTIIGVTKDTEEITIPKIYEGKKIKHFADDAFSNVQSLKRVYYEGTPEDWLSIEIIYRGDPMWKAEEMYFLNEKGEYYLFDSYTYDGKIINYDNFFRNMKCLKTIYVTKEVEEIRNGCIGYNCFVEEVYYEGTKEDWEKIKFRTVADNPMYEADKMYFLDEYGNHYLVEELYFDVENLDLENFLGFDCLKTLRLSKNVKSIVIGFCQLYNLEKVYFEGTLNEWLNISFKDNIYHDLRTYAEEIYVKNESGEYVLVDFANE
ncbi:MAG: hypothetical protein IJX78_07620 [Bacilli bacterium]|nr:hypothetical protein [Bacilli bacterium]